MGRDECKMIAVARIHIVSIHAPAWGATVARFGVGNNLDGVSIHAPAWGATLPPHQKQKPSTVSIHAPAWGATTDHAFRFQSTQEFQSTRPHGARLPTP